MSTPNLDTASILNDIVINLNKSKQAADIVSAASEFALGYPKEVRDLYLCLGFNKVNSLYEDNTSIDLIIGKGFARRSSNQVYSTAFEYPIYSELPGYTPEMNINIQTELGNTKFRDVYAFGNITFDGQSSPVVKLTTFDTVPLLMVRDVSETDIVSMIEQGIVSFPTVASNSVELLRFIVSIDDYTGIPGDARNNLKIITLDTRRLMGWFGFAEEKLAVNMIPSVVLYKNEIDSILESYSDIVNDIVANWLNLEWDGGFVNYWVNLYPSIVLPTNLYNYIQTNFIGYEQLPSLEATNFYLLEESDDIAVEI